MTRRLILLGLVATIAIGWLVVGRAGSSGSYVYVRKHFQPTDVHPYVTVSCPAGRAAISGGVNFPSGDETSVFESYPVDFSNGIAHAWRFGVVANDDPRDVAFVVCAG